MDWFFYKISLLSLDLSVSSLKFQRSSCTTPFSTFPVGDPSTRGLRGSRSLFRTGEGSLLPLPSLLHPLRVGRIKGRVCGVWRVGLHSDCQGLGRCHSRLLVGRVRYLSDYPIVWISWCLLIDGPWLWFGDEEKSVFVYCFIEWCLHFLRFLCCFFLVLHGFFFFFFLSLLFLLNYFLRLIIEVFFLL